MRYRYPGAKPFETKDSPLFFGRDTDLQNLYRLIRLENLVVLYGKSGLGKTSLLNAAVVPQLKKDQFLSYKIRFNAAQKEESTTPLERFIEQITPFSAISTFLDKIAPNDDSMWYRFKQIQLLNQDKKGIVLIFDQFEELFTYSSDAIEEFKKQLAHILNLKISSVFQKALKENRRHLRTALTAEEWDQFDEPLNIKVVIGIRSDKLFFLNKMTDYLPEIQKKHYELSPFSQKQALVAITAPAALVGDFDRQEPFTYEDAALDKIIKHLSDEDKTIEPYQLQYVCEYVERAIPKNRITANALGDLKQMFDNFYQSKIVAVGNVATQKKVRRLLEDGLIYKSVRLSLLEVLIVEQFGVGKEILNQLVNNLRLLRSEQRNKRTYYEITHDTLVTPILKAKGIREEKEKRWRLFRLILLVGGIAVFAFGLTGWALLNYQEAKKQEKIAEKKTKEALEQKGIAEEKTALAEVKTKEALKQTAFAEAEKENAKKQEKIAKRETEKAQKQRKEAEFHKKQAEKQKVAAEAATKKEKDLVLALAAANKELDESNKNLEKAKNKAIQEGKSAQEAAKKAKKEEEIALAAKAKTDSLLVEIAGSGALYNLLETDGIDTKKIIEGIIDLKDKIIVLNLSNLDVIPFKDLSMFSNLERLVLRNNNLKQLPKGIEKLKKLNSLEVYGNYLTTFPMELKNLPKLRYLDLGGNLIEHFTEEIKGFSSLRTLILSYADFTKLPSSFSNFTQLTTLDLSSVKFKESPVEEILELENLKKLIIEYSNFLEKEIDRIQKALPKCKIITET